MATSYAKLQSQIVALQRQAELVKKTERAGVVERIKEAIATCGLTAQDLFSPSHSIGERKKRSANGALRDASKRGALLGSSVETRRPAAKKSRAAPPTTAGGIVAVKYRDGDNAWTGRGSRPRWLQAALADGRTLDQFRVAAA